MSHDKPVVLCTRRRPQVARRTAATELATPAMVVAAAGAEQADRLAARAEDICRRYQQREDVTSDLQQLADLLGELHCTLDEGAHREAAQ